MTSWHWPRTKIDRFATKVYSSHELDITAKVSKFVRGCPVGGDTLRVGRGCFLRVKRRVIDLGRATGGLPRTNLYRFATKVYSSHELNIAAKVSKFVQGWIIGPVRAWGGCWTVCINWALRSSWLRFWRVVNFPCILKLMFFDQLTFENELFESF